MKPSAGRLLITFLSLIIVTNLISPKSARAGSPNEVGSSGWTTVQSGSTYRVDRLTDGNPAGGGDGKNLAGDLRYAITNAQTGDSITFNVTGTIKLSSILPALTRDISIQGVDGLTIHGGGGNVFSVANGANIILSNLTVTGGVGNGGGIFNDGALTLNVVTVSGNKAGDPTNGGGTGAGIWNSLNGTLTLNNSTVSGNTVLGNSSYNPSRGGGIANYGTLTLNNSTVSSNSASEGFGGGISNTLPTSILMLNNSTISNNSATGVIGAGSGIDNHGTVHTHNTIIAGNTDDNLLGAIVSQGHNLIGNTTGGSGFRPDLGDLLDTDPKLGPLNNYGGYTQTHALLQDSPAIDLGDASGCPPTDQRGYSRPGDGDKNGIAVCDIGSYEFGDGLPPSTSTAIHADTLTPKSTPTPVFTNTPTSTAEGTPPTPFPIPTSTPTPPPPTCAGNVILLVTISFLMRLRLQ